MSSFSVAGMSSSTSSHAQPSLNTWGNPAGAPSFGTSTLGDSLAQSRSNYQSGYLMSTSQQNVGHINSVTDDYSKLQQNSPQGGQRTDEIPIVPTKAKLNHSLMRGSTSDFGRESMFESTRSRQKVADQDAPPTASVNDIPNETPFGSSSNSRLFQKSTAFDTFKQSRQPPQTPPRQQPIHVIVFGYPAEKYAHTVEYFKSLGDCTEPETNTEIINCFRIGYFEPGDALRAMRKNGEILGGSWIIGTKWADATQAESVFGSNITRHTVSEPVTPSPLNLSNAMMVDEPPTSAFRTNTPTVGTPVKLAPASSVFRKPGVNTDKSSTPQNRAATGPGTPMSGVQTSPTKGMFGQVSDLIFGW